jgi:hypothetical protein
MATLIGGRSCGPSGLRDGLPEEPVVMLEGVMGEETVGEARVLLVLEMGWRLVLC